jgi:hypothetical protein
MQLLTDGLVGGPASSSRSGLIRVAAGVRGRSSPPGGTIRTAVGGRSLTAWTLQG